MYSLCVHICSLIVWITYDEERSGEDSKWATKFADIESTSHQSNSSKAGLRRGADSTHATHDTGRPRSDIASVETCRRTGLSTELQHDAHLIIIEVTMYVCVWQPIPRTVDVTVTKIAGYVRVRILMNPVAYPELVSGGFPKVANLSGW